jgi:sortase A
MIRRRRVLRPLLRFAASVMATSGALLIADAGITLAWQEPISAFIASRQQAELERELEDASKLAARDKRALPRGDLRRRLAELARRHARRTGRGDAIGRIDLPTLDRSYVMPEGTDTATLRKGPSHYPDTPLPGQGGTVAVAGHRTTYGAPFRPIDRLERGDRIVASMPYGRFTYRVERTKIVAPDALWVKNRVRYERIILTACNPLYSARQRIVVFARLASFEAS